MGWASGFQAGTAMSKQWLDTYRQAKQERLMAEANERAKLGDYQQYTAEYGRGLESKAAMRDERGRPMWDISIEPGSTQYQVRQINYADSTPAPMSQDSIDYAGWESKYGNAGLRPPEESLYRGGAQTSAVPMDYLPSETRVGLAGGVQYPGLAEGIRVEDQLPRPDLGAAMTPRSGGLASNSQAMAQYANDLGVSPRDFTESLMPAERPQESGLYGRLVPPQPDPTRFLGEVEAQPEMKTTYMGRQYDAGKLTDAERMARRNEAYADVYEQLGKPEEALRFRAMAAQERRAAAAEERAASLFPLQKEGAEVQLASAKDTFERQKTFRDGLSTAMKETDPDKRTEAVFNAYMAYEPLQAAQLKASLTDGQLKDITLKAKQFEQGFSQAFTKGETAVMQWLDEQNSGFKLELRGNQIVQINEDGSSRVFAQGTPTQRMEQMAGQASPENFLKLAQINATRDYQRAVLSAKTSVAKVDPARKEYVDYLERESMAMQKALAQSDPSDPNYGRLKAEATRARFAYFKALQKDLGIDVDPYGAVGAPTPTALAGQLKGMSVAEAEKRLNAAEQMFGPEYADAARKIMASGGGVTKQGDTGNPFNAKPGQAAPTDQKGGLTKSGAQAPVDVSRDPVLTSIRNEMAKLDPKDPANISKIQALGTARNTRIEQLRNSYGSMTELKTD